MKQLGLDIGGSGIKGAIVDTNTGEFLTDRHKIKTPRPATPKEVSKVVKKMVNFFEWDAKVGCCFPTIVKRGVAYSYGNISPLWLGLNIEETFKKKTGLEFYVGNDADLAGVAEMKFGAGKGKKGKVLMVTIGTGLGTALFYNGILIPNMEFGRILHQNGEPIEFYAADSARKKEKLSIDMWAKRFNFYLNHIIRIISPDLIIIGGGISRRFEEFKQYIDVKVPVEVAHFRNRAGIIGAAMYAAQEKQIEF